MYTNDKPRIAPILISIITVYWRSAKFTTIFIIVCAVIGACASISAPYLFSRAVDTLISSSEAAIAFKTLLLYALVYGIATAFGEASRFLTFLCAERLSYIADSAFFIRLLRKTPAFFLDNNPLAIGTAQREGAQTLNIITQLGIGGLLPGITQILISAALLGQLMSWEISIIVLVYGAIIITLDYIRVGRVGPFLDKAMECSQDNAHLVGNAVSIVDTLRQTRSEKWISDRFILGAQDAYGNWRRYALASSVFSGVRGIAAALQIIVTFLVILPKYYAGLISVGDLVLFNTLLVQLNEPFHLVGIAIKETVEAAARFRPLARMWSSPEALEPSDPVQYHPVVGSLTFEDVAYRYPDGRGISELSFEASRGTPTFIVGETGAGKSTVLRLILKAFRPDAGRILADGTNLSRIGSKEWFEHIGVVPQEVGLLNDTLATNIVLGREFNIQRLRDTCAQASILTRIEAMPEGFETIVGERGLKLSGGERQRIAIARALYGSPSILVLDEASSALDEETERQIMDGLRSISKDITIIAVTHRLTSILPTDNMVRLPSLLCSVDNGEKTVVCA